MTAKDRRQLIADVKHAEGWRSKAYQDSVGVWTIGFGRNLQTMTISQELGEAWLKDDLENAESELRVFKWFDTLTSKRRAVLVEMNFNLGLSKLRRFTRLLAAIEQGNYVEAADQMMSSLWSQQVGARAKRLAEAMRKG